MSTPRRVARNGGAARVRFNCEDSKSASSPVCVGKFKKQRLAPRENVWPRDWKLVLRYATGGCGQLDAELAAEDIDFDMYKSAGELMKLSGMKMLPEEEVQSGGLHLWRLLLQASTTSN